jgi:hypothetical protein
VNGKLKVHHALHVREARDLPEGRRFSPTKSATTLKNSAADTGFSPLNSIEPHSPSRRTSPKATVDSPGPTGEPSSDGRGAIPECMPVLKIARQRGLFKDLAALAPRDRLEVIARMISGLINFLDKRDR